MGSYKKNTEHRRQTDNRRPSVLLCLCSMLSILTGLLCSPAPTLAAAQAFTVLQARLGMATSAATASGKIHFRATVDDRAAGASLEAALLAGTVTLSVRDASQFCVAVPVTVCMRKGAEIRCSDSQRHLQLRLKRTATPLVHEMWVGIRNLSRSLTGAGPLRAPVRVAVQQQGSPDQIDVISDCSVSQSQLTCLDRRRPNIVFIVTDDQRWDALEQMPHVLEQLAGHGVRFTDAFVTSPTCAPSRASMLTGQYARHHGVLTLAAPDGGATRFVGTDASTLATWLHAAGYRTGMYGKYLTDYSRQCPPYTTACYIPPGWDEWHVFSEQHYYDYLLAENDRITRFGSTPADYSTDVLSAQAVEFIRTAHGQPFFLHVGFNAPHQEGVDAAIPAPRHDGIFADITAWRPPSYDEEDVSDKPAWLGRQPRADTVLSGVLTRGVWGDFVRRRQLETLLAIDDAVDAIVAALETTGQADNTVIVFTSDNGQFWGEHRFFYGKKVPYDESLRVPLIIRYPRLISAARRETRPALNIDLVPTLAALAAVPIPESVDGADLTPLLTNTATSWRTDFVVELWHTRDATDLPTYAGLRSDQWKYLAYPSASEAELYDLVHDPYELDNRAHDPAYADVVSTLQARLDALLR